MSNKDMVAIDISTSTQILTIDLDEKTIVKRHPQIEREKQLAVKNLLISGALSVKDDLNGPFHLSLAIAHHNLVLVIKNECKSDGRQVQFSLRPYRRIIKDYFIICESYQKAQMMNEYKGFEAIDMARRSVHDEGAAMLQERLKDSLVIDCETARNLFSLICVMHIGGVVPW